MPKRFALIVAVGIDRILKLVFLVSCRILVDEVYALRLLQVGVFDMVTREEEEVEAALHDGPYQAFGVGVDLCRGILPVQRDVTSFLHRDVDDRLHASVGHLIELEHRFRRVAGIPCERLH